MSDPAASLSILTLFENADIVVKGDLLLLLAAFLFPSGPRLVAAIRSIQARLQLQRGQDFVALAGATIRTVSQGVIGIAIVQSLLVGIGLKLAGIAHAAQVANASPLQPAPAKVD